jgi:glycosyltransferase involved in cell wall biosynthesis
MKIIYHHRTLGRGVEGVHISGVINGLKRLGHEVNEVALSSAMKNRGETGNGRPRKQAGLLRLFTAHVPNTVFRAAEVLYNLWGAPNMALALARHRDTDFIYERYAYFCFSTVLAARTFGVPVILEVNVTTDFKDTRALAFHPMCRAIEQWVLESSDRIFVVSELLKQALVQRGIAPDKIVVQPNAVEPPPEALSTADPKVAGLLEQLAGRVVVTFLGRLMTWYQLDRLIGLFAEVHGDHPESALLLVGDGPEREPLVGLARKRGVEDSVIFAGNVAHGEVMVLLQASQICVIPATNEWTSPVKLFEYMASGTAVVAPDFESISTVMIDGEHGRLFPPGDFDGLKRQLTSLLADRGTRERMGQSAREHVLRHFTWDHVGRRVVEAYDGIAR